MKKLQALLAVALLLFTFTGCSGCDEENGDGEPDAGEDVAVSDSGDDTTEMDSGDDTTEMDSGDEVTPSDIAGLTLHLTAGEGVTTSQGAVSEWADNSGNGNDFAQSEAAYRPAVVSSAVNGLPAVEFNGEDQQLDRADSLGLDDDQARTVFVVGKLSSLESRMPFFMQGVPGTSGDTSNYFGLEANTFNTTGERFGFYLVSHAFDTAASTNTDYNVHALRTGGFPSIGDMEQASTYYLNGQMLTFSQTPNNATNPTFMSTATAVGGFPVDNAPSTVLDGQIAEVLVYEGALSDEDVGHVNDFLLEKYGL